MYPNSSKLLTLQFAIASHVDDLDTAHRVLEALRFVERGVVEDDNSAADHFGVSKMSGRQFIAHRLTLFALVAMLEVFLLFSVKNSWFCGLL